MMSPHHLPVIEAILVLLTRIFHTDCNEATTNTNRVAQCSLYPRPQVHSIAVQALNFLFFISFKRLCQQVLR